MGLWLTLSIAGAILVCCVKESASQGVAIYELEQRFTCFQDNPVIIANTESTLSLLTLKSPCYPKDYTTCPNEHKYSISVLNVPVNVWIGVEIIQISTTADSEDKLQIATKNETLFTAQLSSTQSGYLYHYYGSLPNNKLFISFLESNNTQSSGQTNKFKLNITFAYVMGRSYGNILAEKGYVVSHENFDYGTEESNNYPDDIRAELIMEDVQPGSIFRFNFLTFELYQHFIFQRACYDYLEISGIKPQSMTLCSYDDPTSDVIEVYPVDTTVSLKFVTSSNFWSKSVSSGFLLQYQVRRQDSCPPTIQNSKRNVTVENGIYIYECEEGYWIGNGSYSHTINCSETLWNRNILPCIVIECELPEISNSTELNFTLSSRGRAAVGTNISYSCNSKRYELTDGTEISTCTSNGEWSRPTPNCTLIVTVTTETTPTHTESSRQPTQTTPIHAESSRHTTEGNTVTMASNQEPESSVKTASSTAGYIAGGVGAAVVVILIVVVVLLLLRRRKSRKENYPQTLVSGDVMEFHTSTQNGDGGIYYLADDEQSSPNSGQRPLPEVYELAGPMEELDANRSADSSGSVSKENATIVSIKPAAAASVGADVDVDASAGVYSLANEDNTDADAATTTRRPGTTTYGEYKLAGPMDAYENANVIERAEREKDISDTYGSVLADRKTKNSGTTTDVMIDNELYGT